MDSSGRDTQYQKPILRRGLYAQFRIHLVFLSTRHVICTERERVFDNPSIRRPVVCDSTTGQLILRFDSGIKGNSPERGLAYWADEPKRAASCGG
jgi:hypothetical protein